MLFSLFRVVAWFFSSFWAFSVRFFASVAEPGAPMEAMFFKSAKPGMWYCW